ncbi:CDP-2,3-bis-(O-geranylgeranyl)-sn-glycerol synthase [Methanolinea mesophila]|uniref:CDP-2,3-bis-(O-geranylgeranyl)-sn-glycerol synthase n=1 Tax=Methanolinea mesophila TaxID=547055 RepID=UPI003158C64A
MSINIHLESVVIALASALWIMLPAYVPNPVAAALGGGRPIDGGRNFRDGKRILGDGKTWRGFITGVIAGILVGLAEIAVQGTGALPMLPTHTVLTVVLFSAGALLGDMTKSFFKRRLGIKSGDQWIIADQYDLVAGAFVLTALISPGWIIANITPLIGLWIVIVTPILHKTANVIGYLAGVKKVPW